MSKPFERQVLPSGKENPKYVDLLDEDKSVAGQKFVCVSFVSPEKILKVKNQFFFEEFLKHWDYSKNIEKFTQFLNFFSQKYNINFDDAMKDFQDFVKSEQSELVKTTVNDDYKNFMDAKEDDLDKEFNEHFSFQTSTRGIKIRGSYPSQQEAELRCKMLREVDPSHDVYVGPVGMWMPWEPEAYKTGRVEYLEEELNQLMHEKNKNEKEARVAFDKRVVEAKKDAIQENIKIAKSSGNKLTQNIDEAGNLVGVGVSTVEKNLKDKISNADIRKELFEGEMIRTRATDKAQAELEKEQAENKKLTTADEPNVTIEEKKD